ncbi:MAG: hypothetical protein J5809_05840 [Selenomonadaceae bacterium]|nr:hypothetical protein [Selenomonadaceae bacterium]
MANDKIRNDEILSDEELDNVAGGSWMQTSLDIIEAGKSGLVNVNPDDVESVANFYQNNRSELTDMFAKFGIEFTHRGKWYEENDYSFNGQKISRDEAWSIINKQLGK